MSKVHMIEYCSTGSGPILLPKENGRRREGENMSRFNSFALLFRLVHRCIHQLTTFESTSHFGEFEVSSDLGLRSNLNRGFLTEVEGIPLPQLSIVPFSVILLPYANLTTTTLPYL